MNGANVEEILSIGKYSLTSLFSVHTGRALEDRAHLERRKRSRNATASRGEIYFSYHQTSRPFLVGVPSFLSLVEFLQCAATAAGRFCDLTAQTHWTLAVK